jgi:hypothetical protein
MLKKHIAKILYWRAKSLHSLGEKSFAILDLQEAFELEPQDQVRLFVEFAFCLPSILLKKIHSLLKEFEDKAEATAVQYVHFVLFRSDSLSYRTVVDTSSLTVNGGWCCQRSGFWSQSVSEVLVYLPAHFIQSCIHSESPESKVSLPLCKSDITVEFISTSISIWKQPQRFQCLLLPLMNSITPLDCTWTLESHNACQYLVLYLTKSSLLPSAEENQTPGMEWWECVCEGDERIDTLLCSVGTNVSELPTHARTRAELEHQRFQSLTAEEQEKERQYLIHMKEEFSKSLERTQSDREREEVTMREVPERAEFLRKLRSEFPHIDFVSK